MLAARTPDGLYTFPLTIAFKGPIKKLTGLVDTGSNICVCTYKIPTTLKARATSFGPISSAVSTKTVQAFGYSLNVGFDGKSVMTHVYRLPLNMPGIDFILGMPILSKCNTTIKADCMEIEWI